MFRDTGETPSRCELLSMVRKHSNLLGQTNVDKDDASDIEINALIWHDVLDLYFLHSTESRRHEDDNVIFFVRKMSLDGYGFNDDKEGNASYLVRRWASEVFTTVYASPSRVNFHLDSKKEVETFPAYPDICFVVDDFDSTFDAVISKRGFSIGLGTIFRKAASVASIAAKLATGSSDEVFSCPLWNMRVDPLLISTP